MYVVLMFKKPFSDSYIAQLTLRLWCQPTTYWASPRRSPLQLLWTSKRLQIKFPLRLSIWVESMVFGVCKTFSTLQKFCFLWARQHFKPWAPVEWLSLKWFDKFKVLSILMVNHVPKRQLVKVNQFSRCICFQFGKV